MWIIPSQLLNSAPDMAALDLASKTSLANDCDASHIVSLRGLLKPISSVKWKKDSWMSHLFGTILRPSLTENFTDWWTSSLQDTLANRSLPQESEQVKMTQDTSGLGSQTEFAFFDQEPASSKMSKDTFRWDSPQSLAIWKSWVTRCRGEYSLRVKSGRLTSGSEFLSWPTAAARDFKGESGSGRQERKGNPADTLPNAVAQWPTPQTGEAKVCMTGTQNQRMLSHAVHGPAAPANWSTPNTMDTLPPKSPEGIQRVLTHDGRKNRKSTGNLREDVVQFGPAAPANHNTHGSRQGWWGTPAANDANKTPHCEVNSNQAGLAKSVGLELQKNQTGKLNGQWVTQLMGLPMGWVTPSCPASVIRNWPRFVSGWLSATIAPTNSDSWATESCQPPPNELFEC